MSEVATSFPSIASIVHDSMRPTVYMVGYNVSSLDIQLLCFLTYACPLNLIVTSSFLTFKNISYASLFLSCLYLRS